MKTIAVPFGLRISWIDGHLAGYGGYVRGGTEQIDVPMEHDPLCYCNDAILRLVESRKLRFDGIIRVRHYGCFYKTTPVGR